MIALICGSPKAGESAAGEILRLVDKEIIGTQLYKLRSDMTDDEIIKKMLKCEKMIFSFPLYVDGIPSHLLRWMERMVELNDGGRHKVYCLVNCGFYEGRHARIALEMMRNFCRQCGWEYCGGAGIGSGGMASYISRIPINAGPKRILKDMLKLVCRSVTMGRSFEDRYITIGISKRIYRAAAQCAFKVTARKNGVKI